MTFATVAGLLGVVALVACVLPAWHVMRLDPQKMLRVE
jgi:ABC-type lipoprotein release transport system permease subunit